MTDVPAGIGSRSEELLSIVVPAYNEEEVLPEFHKRLCLVLEGIPIDAEIVYVNDGSTDETLRTLEAFRKDDPRVAVVDLSRNFGKEIALTAGIDHAKGDAVVVIDADLQDPPELIGDLLFHWRSGYDVVYATRTSRRGETAIKKATAHIFYRLANGMSRTKIPEDTGDFRLLSRRAVDSLKELRERHRFMKGLFSWVGYSQTAVTYTRDPRYAGETKWNYWRLWNFALEGITSFTIAPLRVATYAGFFIALGAFIYAMVIAYKTLVWGNPVKGYSSLAVIILFMSGVNLAALGVIGEYVGRIFDETKNRPLYFVKDYVPPRGESVTLPEKASEGRKVPR